MFCKEFGDAKASKNQQRMFTLAQWCQHARPWLVRIDGIVCATIQTCDRSGDQGRVPATSASTPALHVSDAAQHLQFAFTLSNMSDETASNAAAKPRSSWSSWLSPLGTSTASTDAPVSNPTELTQPSAAVTGNAESKSEMDGAGAPPDIAGTWQKDEGASDQNSYAEQVKMLHMSSLYTYAALHYMWGLDISTDDAGDAHQMAC